MCAALDRAGALAHRWIASFPDSFPPLVINLTDGEATDGDPQMWATRLRSLSTTDGPVLLFNLSLSSVPATPVLFPTSSAGLPSREAAALFEMSSLLPEIMLEGAGTLGEPVRLGARGFGCNADLKGIVTFLNIGTSIGRTPT